MTVGKLAWLGAILADGALTGGAYELFEAETPVGAGPPLHVHRERDEGFYVVAGRYGIWCDGQVREAGPGAFVLVPRGTVHRFEARAEGSKLLFIVSPPGLEGFFRDGGDLEAAGWTDREIRLELAGRYDSHPVVSEVQCLMAGGAAIGSRRARLFLSEHRGDARPDTLVQLFVSDIAPVMAEFGRPADAPPYGCEIELRDPDGNRLRISTARGR